MSTDLQASPLDVPVAARARRIRNFVFGVVITVACMVAVISYNSNNVRYGSLDPFKDTVSTELFSENLNSYEDPFQVEKSILSGNSVTGVNQGVSARDAAEARLVHKAVLNDKIANPSASRLLEKARAALAKRGPAIQALISSAKRLDRELRANTPVAGGPSQHNLALGRMLAKGERTSGLYYTQGGYGPYPADDGSGTDLQDNWDDEKGPVVGVVTDDDSSDESQWSPSVSPAIAAIGAAVARQSPLDWFLRGPQTSQYAAPAATIFPAVNHPRPQPSDDGRDDPEYDEDDENEYNSDDQNWPASVPANAAGPSTPVLDRVKKLIDLKHQAEDIQSEQARVLDDVFADAENGNMAKLGGGPEAAAFSEGFLEGAVEASKKSLAQQREFADMLQRQQDLVARLEEAVRNLEDHQRQENWAKTAAQYPDDLKAPSSPPAAPSSSPKEEVSKEEPEPPREVQKQQPVPAPEPAPPAKKRLVTGQPEQVGVPVFNVDFYMEAMCPGCIHFTTAVLAPVLNALEDYVELRAIPYGNAAIVNGSVQCQHGPDECTGNKIELCMMREYPGWRTWFPAFKCIEDSPETPLVAARGCLKDHGMDADRVIACANSEDGTAMELAAGNETIRLDPPHQFTPWVVVNGEAVGDKVMDLQGWLCERLPTDHRVAVAACAPSKFHATKGAQSLRSSPGAPHGACFPTLPWDGTR